MAGPISVIGQSAPPPDKQPEEELAESRNRLSAALRAGRLGVHEFHPQEERLIWDDTVRALWGLPADQEPTYALFLSRIHPEDREATQRAVEESLDPRGARRYTADYRVRNMLTGSERWIHANGDVTFSGEIPTVMIGTVQDITEEKQLQEENALLMRELEHRGKNLLSMVQALASQTFGSRTDASEELKAFNGRIRALDALHAGLVRPDWQSTDLHTLIIRVLQVCLEDMSRVTMEGPEIRLGSRSAQQLALVLNELCTNALKYGALKDGAPSTNEGRIVLQWCIGPDLLQIAWSEQGGPPVEEPLSRGFGSVLIARAIPPANGSAKLEFAPDGVRCTIKIRGARQFSDQI